MIGLMQPMTFPAMSLFEYISKVDKFYYLDDVQLSKQSFQTRNLLYINKKRFWIKIPIKKISLNQKINETKIDVQNWYRKFENTVCQNYSRSYYLTEFRDIFNELINEKHIYLSDFNISFTQKFIEKLGIKTPVEKTSNIKSSEDKIDRIINLMKRNNDYNYLAVPGSLEYMKNGALSNSKNFNIYKFIYKPMDFETYDNRLSCLHYLLKFGFKKLSASIGTFSSVEYFNFH